MVVLITCMSDHRNSSWSCSCSVDTAPRLTPAERSSSRCPRSACSHSTTSKGCSSRPTHQSLPRNVGKPSRDPEPRTLRLGSPCCCPHSLERGFPRGESRGCLRTSHTRCRSHSDQGWNFEQEPRNKPERGRGISSFCSAPVLFSFIYSYV